MTDRLNETQTRAAKLAAAAASLKHQSGIVAPFCLAFMTDRERVPEPAPIVSALPPGAAVILRDYRDPGRAALAKALKALCDAHGLIFLVGADWPLAVKVQAAGVHLPSWSDWGSPAPAGMVTSAACHTAEDLAQAAQCGAAAAFLSPAFASASHPGARGLGVAAFKSLAAKARLPVLALGGVTAGNAAQLAGPNVAGLGAIGAFCKD